MIDTKYIENSKKSGMAIGIISSYTVPTKWMFHQQYVISALPGGLHHTYIYDIADFKKDLTKNYASSRTSIVKEAIRANFKWLMFIDSDVFLPLDGIGRMMSHDKDIVTGVYWMKKQPPEPVIYKEIGSGPIWNIEPSDELMEIGGAGLGCTLVKLSVFDKFIENGIPFFRQDWVHDEDNKKVHVSIGEDHWFFSNARKLGFKVWCDTNVLCDHYSHQQDKLYPGEKEVKRICSKKLREDGMKDIIEDKLLDKNTEGKKQTIVFFNSNIVPFDGYSIEKKPISGSETAVIQMAKNFKEQGWNVQVYCNIEKEQYCDDISYLHFRNLSKGIKYSSEQTGGKEIDVFVSSRDIRPFLGGRPPVKTTILWLHDMPGEHCKGMLDTIPYVDKYFFVSKFQQDAYQKYFKNQIPEKKLYITKNGLDEDRFDKIDKIPKRRGMCIYATTPFRGLDVLIDVWPEIKKRVPLAELHVFSGMSIYNQPENETTQKIFDRGKEIAEENDIFFHKPVKQDELAYVLMRADVMLYPCHFEETSCIGVMEAIKAKTPVITSNLGALPETILKYEGILINGDSYNEGYSQKFIEKTVKMLTDNDFRDGFCLEGRDMSWKTVAKEWIELFTKGNKGDVK